MKKMLLALTTGLLLITSCGQSDSIIIEQKVEISCGQCNFNMDGNACDLAIRIGDNTYFTDGSSIDDHGNSHATDGFCSVIRKAIVSGEIKNERFIASEIEILPAKN